MLMARCPKCSQVLQMADEFANKVVRCSACGQALQMPAAGPRPVPPASPHSKASAAGTRSIRAPVIVCATES